MWTEKYRPEDVAQIVGNEEAKVSFTRWLERKQGRKAALLYGPAGVGKTALVHAMSKKFQYEVIEMNASDTRTEKTILKIAGPSTTLASLEKFSRNTKGSLLLFDEVDGIFGKEDRGGVAAITKLVEQSQVPVVLTANDPDLQKLRPLKKVVHLIRFRRVRIPLVVALLQKICKNEGIVAEHEALEIIAQNSQGDVRSAINDLQSLCKGKQVLKTEDIVQLPMRNRALDIHDTLTQIFSARTTTEALAAIKRSSFDYDTFLLTIHDNLPLRYSNPDELSVAYDILSKADVFRGRIRQENWGLLSYFFGLLAWSSTVAPETYQPFDFMYPPKRILAMFWTKNKRILMQTICAKIGKKCHVSKKSAYFEFMPFIKAIVKKEGKSRLPLWFGLDKKETDYIKALD